MLFFFLDIVTMQFFFSRKIFTLTHYFFSLQQEFLPQEKNSCAKKVLEVKKMFCFAAISRTHRHLCAITADLFGKWE